MSLAFTFTARGDSRPLYLAVIAGLACALAIGKAYSKRAGLAERDIVHSSRLNKPQPLVEPAQWADTAVEMPADLSARALFDWLSPAAPKVDDHGLLYLRDALAAMPVAVLVEDGVPRS